jgi:hypothetical protein
VSAVDEDGSYDAAPRTVTVGTDWLKVQTLTPTPSGFAVRFNDVFDASTVKLYDLTPGASFDVQLKGDTTGVVAGSMVVDADGRGLSFVRSGGVLKFDTYTVTLASGLQNFHDGFGALDGNGDGTPGDAYVGRFDFRSTGSGVLSLPDFMRGPGQAVDVPATAALLPISFTGTGGLNQLVFTLDYNPGLLDITGASVAAGMPAGTQVSFDNSTVIAAASGATRQARITVTLPGTGTLAAGTATLVNLTADVPASAPYGAKQVLNLALVSANGSAASAAALTADAAVQVVGYFGDSSGNAAYSSLDVQQLQRVIVKSDVGFAAWANVDPVVIADIAGGGSLNSLDATRLLQEISFLTGVAGSIDRPEIPPIPAGSTPIAFAGPDPVLDLGAAQSARPGDVIQVPVRLDTAQGLESVQLRIAYDSTQFDLKAVQRGDLSGDFDWFISKAAPGSVVVDMSRLNAITDGSGTLLELVLQVRADAQPGRSLIDLQFASLNDGHLTLSTQPQSGADASDTWVTLGGAVAASADLAPGLNLQATPENLRSGRDGAASAQDATLAIDGDPAATLGGKSPRAPSVRLDRLAPAAAARAATALSPPGWWRGFVDQQADATSQRLTSAASLKVLVPTSSREATGQTMG